MGEVQRDEVQEHKYVDASFLLDAIQNYKPVALPDVEAKSIEASVVPAPSATTQPLPVTTQPTTSHQDAVKEPKTGPWSE